MTLPRVLVVDDEQSMCDVLQADLGTLGFSVDTALSGIAALALLRVHDFDVVVTDLNMRGMNGLELCERSVSNRPDVPVVVLTAFGSFDTAITAIRVGAYDFITKPFEVEVLAVVLRRAIEHRRLRAEVRRLREAVSSALKGELFLGDSTVMRHVAEWVDRVASADAPVLITGESGTGKEVLAKALHARSPRRDRPFVGVNCAAIPEALLESELFGHAKGAFTDAKGPRVGLFAQAEGGTLFLDELGDMPPTMQAKLLRALQDRKVRPLGGVEETAFDARIVAATNRDLEARISEGSFREDLLFRLDVLRIELPPLRSRGQDILFLAQRFIEVASKRSGKPVSGMSPEVAKKLMDYAWPGNVRELENVIERAVVLTGFEVISVGDLPDRIQSYTARHVIVAGADPEELVTLDEVERRYIERVMESVGSNKVRAAQVLGIDRATLYRKLDRYGKGPR